MSRLWHANLIGMLLLAACDQGSSQPDTVRVYADGALQCEPQPTLASNAQILIGSGIDVLWSSCGVKTGVAVVTVCGAPSLEIFIHEIRSMNLQDAENLGYRQLETLVDASAGTGYELTDC